MTVFFGVISGNTANKRNKRKQRVVHNQLHKH